MERTHIWDLVYITGARRTLTMHIRDVFVADRSTFLNISGESGAYLKHASSNCNTVPCSGSVSGNL